MKKFILNKRKAGTTHDYFSQWWRERHGPLLFSIPVYKDYTSLYVQNHIAGPGPYGSEFPFDGVSEVGQVDPSGVNAFSSTAVYRERVLPDELAFLDRDGSLVFEAEENIVIAGRGEAKILAFYKRNPKFTHQQFIDYWSSDHVKLLLNQPDFKQYCRGYTQYHIHENAVRPLTGSHIGDRQIFDGMADFRFDNVEDAHAAFSTAGYQSSIKADEASFLAESASISCLVQEVEFHRA